MMLIAAIFETIGIGLIVPLVGIITDSGIIQEQKTLKFIYDFFGFQSTTKFVIFSVIILLFVFIFKNIYLLIFNYAQFKVILNQQVKLSQRLFREYLVKPYVFHLQRNTAGLLRNVNEEVPRVFQGIIISSFQLFTEILVSVCIFALLLVTAPIATVSASILLGGSVFIFFKYFKRKISDLGKEQQTVNGTLIKWINQGLGASKEVKVSGKEYFFIKEFTVNSQIKANNSRYMKMLDQVPRLFIETLLVSIVLFTMLIIVFQGTNTTELVSTMALFSMAAFRIMPSITRIVSLLTTIRYSQPALSVVYEDLFTNNDNVESNELNLTHSEILINKGDKIFKESIELEGVSFCYPNQNEYSINNVSLTIPIGQSVAVIGESGAGKTTIIDIILGLFTPLKGKVLVDGKEIDQLKGIWQQRIGYIPQSIFLSDDTIRNNVAFGIGNNSIDDSEVWRALDQAQLKGFVEALPEKLDTMVGERGVRMSGGQKQRIGIARALYHNPEVLFMDEATSALDNKTEKEIMTSINQLKGEKTLIIIAHRLSTIENCDVVFKMKNGRLESIEKQLKAVQIN